jgi:dephospho-CoA kinase
MYKVGITGGIGSGKSTICKLFELLEVPVYYADARAKLLMWQDKSLKLEIKNVFGNEVYHSNGRINRALLANKIFSNTELLKTINNLVHPVVQKDTEAWLNSLATHDLPYALKEAAIMIESGSHLHLDALIVVTCPLAIRIKRVLNRDRSKAEEIKRRINSQMPDEERLKYANYIINNDGTESIVNQVWTIHSQLVVKSKLA